MWHLWFKPNPPRDMEISTTEALQLISIILKMKIESAKHIKEHIKNFKFLSEGSFYSNTKGYLL